MSIYTNIYDLITTYIYGGVITAGSYEELVCVLVSTLACLLLVAIPFILVIKIIVRLV